jgi:26S proteasome regulatory subunit T5
MATLEDLDDLERQRDDDKKEGGEDRQNGDGDKKPGQNGDAEMGDAEEQRKEEENVIDDEILNSSTREILARKRLLENDTRIMRSEFQRLTHEKATMNEKIKDNHEKIQNNRFCIGSWIG